MRCVVLGRKNYLFVGSEGGGKAAAMAYTLIETAKLNGVEPLQRVTGCRQRCITVIKVEKAGGLSQREPPNLPPRIESDQAGSREVFRSTHLLSSRSMRA